MAKIESDEVKESATSQEVSGESADKKMDDNRVSRRRALIVGLAATPAILSLMNRSAWGGGTDVSCNLVNSYVNAGHRWASPRPSNNNGTLTVSNGDIQSCQNSNRRTRW
jgi:hypothetical protein